MNEPSWTTVEAGAGIEAGDGEGRRKDDRESFDRERADLSAATTPSWRETGTGEVGLLEGRKRDVVVLRAYIVIGSRSRGRGR